jgi:hypothetical protein
LWLTGARRPFAPPDYDGARESSDRQNAQAGHII